MKQTFISLLSLAVLFLASCSKPEPSASSAESTTAKEYDFSVVHAGGVRMVPIETAAGTFNVWTKKIGDNPRVKILLLHGGPSATHEYMECMESFFPNEGWEMYHYDQLGSYRSDNPGNDDLWTLERFVEEVEQVRQALGLNKDNFYILGNSWGGILGMEYALQYQQNMKGLIVANMMGSFDEYEKYNAQLRSQMRPSLVDSLLAFENKGDFHNPEYVDIVFREFYTKHLCRLEVWPEPVNRSFAHLNQHVYELMQGPSEFVPGGRLKGWTVMDRLHTLTVPTLMIGAKYDTMDPAHKEKMAGMVQNGRYLYCPNGSHLAMWDDQEHFFPGVIQFIKDVDEGRM